MPEPARGQAALLTARDRDLPRLLPPLARGRDWLASGIGAGLCLGGAEALALHAQRAALAPGPALSLVAADAASVAMLSAPLALATAAAKRHLHHSAVAGGTLGLVLLAPVVPRALALAQGAAAGEAVRVAAGAGVAALCGLLAAAAGARLERAGVPISGPPLWAAVALLVAAGSAFREGGPIEPGPALWLAVGAVVLLLALCAAFFAVFGASRASVVPWPWSRTLFALALAAAAIAVAPRAAPWVFLEPPAATPAGRHPDVLVISLGAFAPGDGPALREPGAGAALRAAPNLTVLAAAGALYRRVVVAPDERAALAWLRLPGGLPLASALRARDYRTRLAGQWSAHAPLPPGFDRADAGESPEGTEQAVRATVGGALLARLGAGGARPASAASVAAGITAEARRRIVAARALGDDRPLLLVVDYSAAERRTALLDDEVGRLLDFLAELGGDENARVAVAWGEDAPADPGELRVLLRPEPAALRAPRGVVDADAILASDLVARIGGLGDAARAGAEAP